MPSPASNAVLLEFLAAASIVLAALALVVWLGVFGVRVARLRRARANARAEDKLTARVLDEISNYRGNPADLQQLPEWQRRLLLRILRNLIEQTKGRDQANLIALLRDAGFHRTALENLRRGRPAERQAACAVLSYFTDEASLAALRAALDDRDAAVRLTAARALLLQDRVDSLAALLRQLPFSETDPPLVLTEVFAQLPTRLHPEAIRLLEQKSLPPEWTRMLALALARNQVFDAFEAIAALRSAAEPRVRAAAWVALTELGDPRAGAFVTEGLRDPMPDVRQVAAKCAGRVGGPEVVRDVVPLLTYGDWWHRYHAAQSLLAFGADGRRALENYLQTAADDDPVRQAWRETVEQGGSYG